MTCSPPRTLTEDDKTWSLSGLDGQNVSINLRLTAVTNADARGWQKDRVCELRASDGHVLWRYDSGAQFYQPVVTDGIVSTALDHQHDLCE